MNILEIDYTTSLEFSSPVTDHYFLLRCVPVSREGQTVVSRNLTITPETPLATSRDIFGNMAYQGRIDFPHLNFSFHSTATVHVDRKNGCRELCHPLFKYNTALTRTSEKMMEYLHSLFKGNILEEAIFSKKIRNRDIPLVAEVLMNAVHDCIEYVPGSTNVRTTAEEAFLGGKGVCQDYTHIFCSLCREAGIPARYVAGTSKGEGSTHAWAEYFVPDDDYILNNGTSLPGKWFGVDCTRKRIVDDTYVSFACGRDYLDCKVDGGIFRGMADQKMTVFVKNQQQQM
ncbi:MAG: transglutaminase family protein [Treponema sp.]|nr:transglutaminase family protein [Candidatus Treponema equifaecale]